MKCSSSLVLLALAAACSLAGAANLSPVSRVSQLLTNLASKIESEMKTEEDLYEDYVCWAKTVISSKTDSNEKAQSRIDSLKTFVADLAAGRIELTSERADLTKEVNTLTNDLEMAKDLRNKENDEYKAATNEMSKAIKALESALKVLEDATKDSKASLVSLRSHIQQDESESQSLGFAARVEEAQSLQKAMDLGSRWLSKGDAVFLKRLLSGEVPQKDWKKLNRKADFKMKYKLRSGKIQDTLTKLLQSFKDRKKEAKKTEDASEKEYETLKEAKEKQLEASQKALNTQAGENGAAAVSKDDAQAEIKDLETQVKDDKKYISETEDKLKDKKKEYVTRKGLRVKEIAAINEANAVIHSDDARDLFKKSISFLQTSDSSATATALAIQTVRSTAETSGDLRLRALAARMSLNGGAKFDKVLKAIEKMIKLLEKEQDTDKSNKEDCEKDREKDTKEAAKLSREIDDLSDDVTKLEGEIEEIVKEVEEKEEDVKDLNKEMKEAKKIRKEENTEWKQADEDDAGAIELLEKAAGVLKNFYKENFSMLQAKGAAQDPPEVNAGEAPPPPPKTWEGDYGGAQKESKGIVGILDVIKSDVEQDKKDAKKAEDKSQKDHDKFIKESEDAVDKLEKSISKLEKSKASKEKDIKSKEESKATKKDSLGEVIKKLKDAKPGCDFLLVNYKVRADSRKLEVEGLKKAKGILEKENK